MPRRREFDGKTKLAAASRATGEDGILRCEECRLDITGQAVHFDHIKRDIDGGDPTLENCAVLCAPCHRLKTGNENTEHAKALRERIAHIGAKKEPKQKIPQRGKPEKPPGKTPVIRRGGIYARYFGGENA